jgi:hypothetical protein
MKVGIMQPYFLPYLGYFKLIDSVDVYVNLDQFSFMKRSYMVRNVLKNDTKININVYDSSQNRKCSDTLVNFENDYIPKFKKTIHHLYSKTKNYELVLEEIINTNFIGEEQTISQFNFNLIKSICDYLDIKTKLVHTSENLTPQKKENGLVDIVNYYSGNTYINAIGGIKLYTKDFFKKKSIDLYFIKSGDLNFENPNRSILDLIFLYDKNKIKDELKNYTLI